MRIVVASENEIKVNAVKVALRELGLEAEVVGVPAKSRVNQQPVDDETGRGVYNRFWHARELDPSGDLYISIENGIFENSGKCFYDRAVILAATSKMQLSVLSEAVPIHNFYVEQARKIGFGKTTVGKVMQERGRVVLHSDPHFSLTGKSREKFLTEAATRLFRQMQDCEIWGLPAPNAPARLDAKPAQEVPVLA